MNTKFFLTSIKTLPSLTPTPAGSDKDSVNSSTTPPKNSGSASALSLYGTKKKHSTLSTISHKNHKHIDDRAQAEIQTIDREILAALNHPDKESHIAAALTKLLDKPFFQPPRHIPSEKIANLFTELDVCHVDPDDNTAARYAKGFIAGYTALQKAYVPEINDAVSKNALESAVMRYLKSNRADKAPLKNKLVVRFADSANRSSAQKMALETLTKAFPLTISDDKTHVKVLKKLIDALPNLEHHTQPERNAQRRGLTVLEKTLGSLQSSDDTAEALTHLMNITGDLSQVPIKYEATAAKRVMLRSSADYQKQPQGTALRLLQDQLAKLRGDWGNVTSDKQQQLIDAFNGLKNNFSKLAGTKDATLKRFFNDSFIDPSKFHTKHNSVKELGKRLHHSLFAPSASKMTNVPGIPNHATAKQKKLALLLMPYFAEAKKAGVSDAKFPAGFLENFIEKTKSPEFDDAASVVHDYFSRIKEMPEYKNPISKPRMLNKIMEMTNRLAVGDEAFVCQFVSTCRLADSLRFSDSQYSNPRWTLKELEKSVILDKALKGEDGLNDHGNLLVLGKRFFHEQELKAATDDLIIDKKAKDIDKKSNELIPTLVSIDYKIEIDNAVEIALGGRFNIPAPVQGVGYQDLVKSTITPEILKAIQEETEKRIDNKEAFINFLMSWEPLTRKIMESPDFKKNETPVKNEPPTAILRKTIEKLVNANENMNRQKSLQQLFEEDDLRSR